VLNNKKYYFRKYPCIDANAMEMKLPEARKIKQIGYLIQKEFGYNVYNSAQEASFSH
jgi:hypothetical protein